MSALAASTSSISFPARLDDVGEASAWLAQRAGALTLSDEMRFNLELCFEEVAVNLIVHGHATRADVSLTREETRVFLTISDDGAAFDPVSAPTKRAGGPLAKSPIGGLGIGLIHNFAHAMSYERLADLNCLKLEFRIPA